MPMRDIASQNPKVEGRNISSEFTELFDVMKEVDVGLLDG